METRFDYDPMYRRRTVTSPGGTMVRTLYDARGLLTHTQMGMSEEDLRLVETLEYDIERSQRLGGGDGHLGRRTLHANPARVTEYKRDFRGRVLTERPGIGGKNVPTVFYSGHTQQGQWSKCTISPTGYESHQRAISITRSINARGHAYKVVTAGLKDKFEELLWTQNAGLVVRRKSSDSEAFLQTLFDGRGRQVISYTGLANGSNGGAGPSITKLDGVIVEGMGNTLDPLGNVRETEHWVRITDDGSSSLKRQTYLEHRYDGIGRLRLTRQLKRIFAILADSSDEPVPWDWQIVPISGASYNARGEPHENYEFVQGETYRKHLTTFDDLERPIRIVRNADGGMPRIDAPDANVTTEFDYCPDGPVSVMRVKNHGEEQVTHFNRGVTASSTASGNGVSSAVSCSYWLASVVDPEGGKTSYGYNALGEVANYQDANGTTHTLAFDTLGRLVGDEAASRGANGKAIMSFGYDFRGFMTSADYPGHATVKRDHDLRGNVIHENQTIFGTSGVHPVRYDYQRGRLGRIVYPSGTPLYLLSTAQATKSNNGTAGAPLKDNLKLNRTSELAWDSPTSTPLMKYDFVGLAGASPAECPIVRGGKETLKQTVDPVNALDEYGRAFNTLWKSDLTHDRFSQSTAFLQTGLVARRHSSATLYDFNDFQHDNLNFLKKSDAGPVTVWKPDSVGNAREYHDYLPDDRGNPIYLPEEEGNPVVDQVHQKRKFNRKNQLTGMTTVWGRKWAKPVYDRVGNAIAIPQPNDPTKLFHCQYDAWNRLIEVKDENGKRVAAYDYDALGRRVLKRRYQNGQLAETRFFYYSHDWRLLEEWHQSPSQPMPKAAVQYAWGLRGPDDLVHRRRLHVSPAEQLTPLQDELSSTKVLFDTSGNIKERYYFTPHGRPAVFAPTGDDPLASSQYDWNILFSGYYYDSETGLYHVRRRMYHPTLGTWLQPDPAGYADGPNLYLYGRGSPVTFNDPSGEIPPLLVVGGIWLAIYLSKVAAETVIGTAAEFGVTRVTGQEFHLGSALARNLASAAVGHLIPGLGEARFLTRVGVWTAQIAARSVAEAGVETWMHGTPFSQNLLMTGIGNVGGDLAGRAIGQAFRPATIRGLVPQSGRGARLLSEYRRFRGQGYSPAAARRLTQPYSGVGHHFIHESVLNDLIDAFGEHSWRGRALSWYKDSIFNLYAGRNLNTGRFYEFHARLHGGTSFGVRTAQAFRMLPGEPWRAARVVPLLRPYGKFGYIVYSSPVALKTAVGSGALLAGGAAYALNQSLDDE